MQSRTALAIFVLLAGLHLWPLSTAPARLSLNYNADAEYFAWALAWIARTLPTDPARLFEANIFSPEAATLAYSHPVVVPALAAAPIRWIGGSPVLMYNVSLLVGLVLTAWTTWRLTREWTGSASAALVAGAAAAFNVHLLTRLPHITAAHAWGLPLTLLFADRLICRPNRRDALGVAFAVAVTAGTSLYWLAVAGLIVAATMLAGRLGRGAWAVGGAALVGLAGALPLLLPYVRMAQGGIRRPIEMVTDFSATPAGYLTSTSVLHAGWSAPFFRDDVNVLFAGIAALALAAVGLGAIGIDARARRRVALLVGLASAAVVLSLGPATAAYRVLYDWLPPLGALRAVARFGYLYLLAVAVLAGFGVAWIQRRVSPRLAPIVAAAALVLVTAEAWQGPVRTEPFTRVPPIYALLAEPGEPVVLVEVPFFPPHLVHFNGEYVLNSTAHWQPLMNGTGGLTPLSYRRRAESFWFFPDDWAIDAIVAEGATHVMVHLEHFGDREREEVRAALLNDPRLRPLAADPLGHRLYRVVPNQP
jgi:hypothetical protein